MLCKTFSELEQKYSFRFPADFHPLYEMLTEQRLIADIGEYELLTAERTDAQFVEVGSPDILPIINLVSDTPICLRMPYGRDQPPMWVIWDWETEGVASLGQEFSGALVALASFMHARGFDLAGDGKESEGRSRRDQARRLLFAVDASMKLKQYECLVPSEAPWSPLFGLLARARWPDGQVVPAMYFFRGKLFWNFGNFAAAEKCWREALSVDSSFDTAHWALGALHALQGEEAAACGHWAKVIEGNWCNSRGRLDRKFFGIFGEPWHADYKICLEYLRRHTDAYAEASTSAAVRKVVVGGNPLDPSSWVEALSDLMRGGRYDEARPIAQSGLLDGGWTSWGKRAEPLDQCLAALIEIYRARGMAARVEKHDSGGK